MGVNSYTLQDYENYKREAERRSQERIERRRQKVLRRKAEERAAAEHNARLWFCIYPGDLIRTNEGVIKVKRRFKDKIENIFGKIYTAAQLYGPEAAKLIKERMKTNNGSM